MLLMAALHIRRRACQTSSRRCRVVYISSTAPVRNTFTILSLLLILGVGLSVTRRLDGVIGLSICLPCLVLASGSGLKSGAKDEGELGIGKMEEWEMGNGSWLRSIEGA